MNTSELYNEAVGGFERYRQVWRFDDFWTRANTCHACIQFVEAARDKWPQDVKIKQMDSFLHDEFIPDNISYFSRFTSNSNGYWADDFGWCGIACLAAQDYLKKVDSTANQDRLLDLAKSCFTLMYDKGYDHSDAAKPIPHGCSNSPGAEPGAKNTVTNANLFVLSLRLYDASKGDGSAAEMYLKMAYDQFLWFSTWFKSDYGYLRPLRGAAGLVQERPIAPPDYQQQQLAPRWEPGWVWTGDQGLLLGSLAGILAIKDDVARWARERGVPNFDPTAFESDINSYLSTIYNGAKIMFGEGFQPTDHVLREAPFESSFKYDPKDYVCGRGVLLRYLSELGMGSSVRSGIDATRQALWNSRDTSTVQFGAAWNPQGDQAFNRQFGAAWGTSDDFSAWALKGGAVVDGILQAAGLDVLGAAIRVSA